MVNGSRSNVPGTILGCGVRSSYGPLCFFSCIQRTSSAHANVCRIKPHRGIHAHRRAAQLTRGRVCLRRGGVLIADGQLKSRQLVVSAASRRRRLVLCFLSITVRATSTSSSTNSRKTLQRIDHTYIYYNYDLWKSRTIAGRGMLGNSRIRMPEVRL